MGSVPSTKTHRDKSVISIKWKGALILKLRAQNIFMARNNLQEKFEEH